MSLIGLLINMCYIDIIERWEYNIYPCLAIFSRAVIK
jgi:hypothetical protein